MGQTFKDGLQIARTRPVVRTLVLISLISGLSSEAFDRLWTVKILEFDFPELFGTSDPAFWLSLFQLTGAIAFALFGNLWLALLAMWVNRVAGSLSYPIEPAWLNRNLESGSRATVISMVSQANAIGQSAGGPTLGALAGGTTVRTALVVSGLILTPIPPVRRSARSRRRSRSPGR